VLGPRLILGIREYHAKLVADSDSATAMTSIAFQEHVQKSTGSNVQCLVESTIVWCSEGSRKYTFIYSHFRDGEHQSPDPYPDACKRDF